MRVRISYGVDIEDVPDEIVELFDKQWTQARKIEKQTDAIADLLEQKEHASAIILIDKLRMTLSKLDQGLMDIQSIAQGYIEYEQQEGDHEFSTGGPTMDSAGSNDDGNQTVSSPDA